MSSPQPILDQIRLLISEEMASYEGSPFKNMTQEDLELAAFLPSRYSDFKISDNPFAGARYVSVADGNCYHLYGVSKQNDSLVALRFAPVNQWLRRSRRRGQAVLISAEGWIEARMVIYQITSPKMTLKDGLLTHIGERSGRMYVDMYFRAMIRHWREKFRDWFFTSPAFLRKGYHK